jgi:hypothetical protein
MSAAIADNAATITNLVMSELGRRAELAKAESVPASNQSDTFPGAAAPEEVAATPDEPPAVSAPAPE